MKSDKKVHVHDYKRSLKRITTDNDGYVGGTMGLVLHRCACGKTRASDYGNYQELKRKYLDKA